MHRKNIYRYGPYEGFAARLWYFEVHLFLLIIQVSFLLFLLSLRITSFVIGITFNYIGVFIDELVGVGANVLKKKYTSKKGEKILGWWYRTHKSIIKWWKEQDNENEYIEEEEITEELPFCQIFNLQDDEDLHIIKVEYCPEETAFIRIVGQDSYTKPYKRKVLRDKAGNRFIKLNERKFYLDPKKTQPRMPE